MNAKQLLNTQVSPRLTAGKSLIASPGYRKFLQFRKTAGEVDPDLVMNFEGDVAELMKRAAYSGTDDGLTSTDHRGAVGDGPGRNVYLQDFLTQGTTGASSVIYSREVNATNAADAVAAGDDKPEQSFDLLEVTAKVAKAAVHLKVTQETFEDYQNIDSFISSQLIRRVKLKIEDLIVNGDGNNPENIVGFQEAGLSTISIATAGSLVESIEESIALIESNGYTPSFVALNPTDKRALYSASAAAPLLVWDRGVLRLLGVPILGTAAVTAGTGVVGDGSQAAILYRSGVAGSAYRTGSSASDQDNFIQGLITIRAEARAALVIQSLGAFVEIVA